MLLLAYSQNSFREQELPKEIAPIALLLLSDKIRDNARETLEYFADQGVDIKVISGDNAVTVANIAKRAGLEKADRFVDATTLKSYDDIRQAQKNTPCSVASRRSKSSIWSRRSRNKNIQLP